MDEVQQQLQAVASGQARLLHGSLQHVAPIDNVHHPCRKV